MNERLVSAGDYYVRDKSVAPREERGRHRHAVATLTVVFSGQLRERFDDGERACGAWSLLYKPAGIPHTTATGPDGVRMLVLGLTEPAVSAHGLRGTTRAVQLSPGAPSVLALSAAESTLRGRSLDGARAAWRLLALTSARQERDRRDRSAPPWLHRVRSLIAASGRFRRDEIARRLGVHPGSLSRAFRRHYGCSLVTYSRQRRADRAIDRLLGEGTTVAGVAHELGYHDQSHLTRELKWAAGVPPAALRQMVRRLSSG